MVEIIAQAIKIWKYFKGETDLWNTTETGWIWALPNKRGHDKEMQTST